MITLEFAEPTNMKPILDGLFLVYNAALMAIIFYAEAKEHGLLWDLAIAIGLAVNISVLVLT